MAQITLYVDEELVRALDRAAKREGKSRSAFVVDSLRDRLTEGLPDSFFEVLGTWDDERAPREILEDIRSGPEARRSHVR